MTIGAVVLALIVRIDPRWRFGCPACGTALTFDPDARNMPLLVA